MGVPVGVIAGVGSVVESLNGNSLLMSFLVMTFPGKLREISLGDLVGIVLVTLPGESPGVVLEGPHELSVGVPVGATLAALPGDSMGISLGEQPVQPLGQLLGQLPGELWGWNSG